jgi:peroxiredoxin
MPIEVGQAAPDFTLQTQDDTEWTLSDHRGKSVVLLWYPLDWSPTCEAENRKISMEPLADGDDVVVVGISRDSSWSHRAWREAREITHDLLSDPELEVTAAFGLVHPTVSFVSQRATVLVGKDGIVEFVQVQEKTPDERDLGALREVLHAGAEAS